MTAQPTRLNQAITAMCQRRATQDGLFQGSASLSGLNNRPADVVEKIIDSCEGINEKTVYTALTSLSWEAALEFTESEYFPYFVRTILIGNQFECVRDKCAEVRAKLGIMKN